MRSYLSERERLIGRSLLLAGLIGVQVPVWYGVEVFAQKLFDNRVRSQQLQIVRHRNDLARKELSAQQDYLSQLDMIVPVENRLAMVIERVELLADETGVELQIKTIREDTGEERQTDSLLKKSQLELEVVGGAANNLAYLAKLEHLNEITVVRHVALGRAEDWQATPEGVRYKMAVSITLHFQGEANGK